jgi:hypothetical protein
VSDDWGWDDPGGRHDHWPAGHAAGVPPVREDTPALLLLAAAIRWCGYTPRNGGSHDHG